MFFISRFSPGNFHSLRTQNALFLYSHVQNRSETSNLYILDHLVSSFSCFRKAKNADHMRGLCEHIDWQIVVVHFNLRQYHTYNLWNNSEFELIPHIQTSTKVEHQNKTVYSKRPSSLEAARGLPASDRWPSPFPLRSASYGRPDAPWRESGNTVGALPSYTISNQGDTQTNRTTTKSIPPTSASLSISLHI